MKTLTCLVLVCGLGFLWVGCGEGSDHPRFGENGRLYVTGDADVILVGIDRDSYDELSNAIVAHDVLGVQQLVRASKVLQVKKNTKVLVIDVSFACTKVRILEGEHAGKAACVPYEFVMKLDDRAPIRK